MFDPAIAHADRLSPDQREDIVLSYWRRGDLTPLHIANSLAQVARQEKQQPRPGR